MTDLLGIVVIGRNEGERLARCLRSLIDTGMVVYVDSGSTDGSQAMAASLGVAVVTLDMSLPFTAARARNAGLAALPSDRTLIQFVDGDCIVQPGWLTAARAALDADPGLGAVFGRRRELYPEASRYNWLCDVEWARAPGPAKTFGGDVMLRRAALDAAGGYPEAMIAGEEPDLSIRMRSLGWTIHCLPEEMTLHDAAIIRFGQWWRRTIRAGHAFAALADRHRGSPLQKYSRNLASALLFGAILPLLIVVTILAAIGTGSASLAGLSLMVIVLIALQMFRIALRERRRRPLKDAAALAFFLMLAKPAEAIGIARYWYGRIGGRRSRIIEYRDATPLT
jgi:GT2 family glycosyltransferase